MNEPTAPLSTVYRNAIISASRVDYKELSIGGSIYDDMRNAIPSARRHANTIWTYVDPEVWEGPLPEAKFASGTYLGHMFTHFGHFLIETLPQLALVNETSSRLIFHGFPATVNLNSLRESKFIPYFLAKLEIDLDQIHLVEKPIAVDSLTVAPRSFLVRGILPFSIAPLLKKVTRDTRELIGFEKVYFTRSELDAAPRTAYERSIEELFLGLGFKVLAPEKKSIDEQIAIAHSCKIMAGLDGSAMHLSMFMKPGGHSVILTTRGRQQAFESVNNLSATKTHWIDLVGSSSQDDPLSDRVVNVLASLGVSANNARSKPVEIVSQKKETFEVNPIQQALLNRGVDLPATPVLFDSVLSEVGITKSYVIAMTGRCGSTWLASSLGQIRNAGVPHEYFSEEGIEHFGVVPDSKDFRQFILSIVQKHRTGNTFGFKIDAKRLSWLRGLIDFSSERATVPLTWIDMRRLNIVKQALSFARAKKSGLWHITSENSQETPSQIDDIADHEIWAEIRAIVSSEAELDSLHMNAQRQPLRIVYEELLDSRDQVLVRVLSRFLGRSFSIAAVEAIEDKTKKIQSRTRDDREFSFCLTHIEQVEAVYAKRARLAVG